MDAETCAFGSVGYVPFVPHEPHGEAEQCSPVMVCNNKRVMDDDARLLIPGKPTYQPPCLLLMPLLLGGRAACIVDLALPWLETWSRRASASSKRKKKQISGSSSYLLCASLCCKSQIRGDKMLTESTGKALPM